MVTRFNLVMTVIGFIVSTMFIIFLCTRLIYVRIHYLSSRRSFHLPSRSDLSGSERGLRGVKPLVLANLPTKKFNDPFFSCTLDARCTICLSEFGSEDTLRILPFCGHFFHSSCIDIWRQQHCTCPVCRVLLRDLSERECCRFPARSPDDRRVEVVSGDRNESRSNEPEAVQNELMVNEGGSD